MLSRLEVRLILCLSFCAIVFAQQPSGELKFSQTVYCDTVYRVCNKKTSDSTVIINMTVQNIKPENKNKILFGCYYEKDLPEGVLLTKTTDSNAVFMWTPDNSFPPSVCLIPIFATDGKDTAKTDLIIRISVLGNCGNPPLGITEEINPNKFKLYQNYPNPFNPETKIKFTIEEESHVILVVHNILGQVVKELINEQKETGNYECIFNAKNITSGNYFYKLIVQPLAGGKQFIETKRMTLLK